MHEITLEFNTAFVRDATINACEELNREEGFKFSYTRDPEKYYLTISAPLPEDFYWLGHRSSFSFKELLRVKQKH